jgi:maleylpyruvate isomerase
MNRTLSDARRWVDQGTKLVTDALAGLGEEGLAAPSALPGWSRKHLLAHLAANAEAVGNLVHWAATGERTPMYSTPEQRSADIESGSRRSGSELVARFERSASALATAMDGLSSEAWEAEVATAQGRTVSASETPWMRAREVMVHAVDLATGVTFDRLPSDFLVALGDDIVGKRSAAAGSPSAGPALAVGATDSPSRWDVAGVGEPAHVAGSLAAVAAYLSGRSADGVRTSGADPVPELPAWL